MLRLHLVISLTQDELMQMQNTLVRMLGWKIIKNTGHICKYIVSQLFYVSLVEV